MRRDRVLRGAAAGAAAAAAWAAVEPLAARACGTRFSDTRLVGRLVPGPDGLWPAAGTALHVANGAALGAVLGALGVRGPTAGLLWASAEGLAAWPGMAVVDRVHPDRRSGYWPRLLTDRRVFAQEAAMHALFGLLYGLGTRRS
ncbi:MAG: hypothetical protein AB7V42_01560 [Thermoleophilia bacterium]